MKARGFTLIEMVVALGIAVVLFSAVVVSVRALTGAKAKESATELVGVLRSLYDSANLRGVTCRLVFELPQGRDNEDQPVKYHAECAKGAITASDDRAQEQRDATDEKKKGKGKLANDSRFKRLDSDDAPTVQELEVREKNRVTEATKFSEYTSEEISPRELPSGVKVTVWTQKLREPAKEGVAYLYFFPQGFTERAQIVLKQGDNAWTVKLSPLTGKCAVVSEELEPPRS
jgi:general secretion pathway protein H